MANPTLVPRAWYSAPIEGFRSDDAHRIVGILTDASTFDVTNDQSRAWAEEIAILQRSLAGLDGWVALEYTIPRMGRRIDAVIIVGPLVVAVEFKVGSASAEKSAIAQVWDYALDLKNFHEASHGAPILPVLVPTELRSAKLTTPVADADGVFRPAIVSVEGLRPLLDLAVGSTVGPPIDGTQWGMAPYRPTPTIIEAARALYANHSVENLARHDAGARNLAATSHRLTEIVADARARGRKVICFVTGVPGAGKTLVGLNLATQRRDPADPAHAVFLSGNGPLVKVLTEALARDQVERERAAGRNTRKGQIVGSVKAFIQNVHHFRDDGLADPRPPAERVVIFDEAQRAWDQTQTSKFMKRRKGRADFGESEPAFLISCMDRHQEWAAIVCLVGGGQEINTGEAGIGAWIDATATRFADWEIHISPRLLDSEYAAASALERIPDRGRVHYDPDLHLSVSMRSFRAERVSEFVKAVLDGEMAEARNALQAVLDRYPIAVTRSLDAAKDWVRQRARGSERFGLLASSRAQRLKPHAIDIRVEVNPVPWFLNGPDDTRSSYYLEDAATEFQVQGLEVDWACVTWDGDMRFQPNGWAFHDFRGDKWTKINKAARQQYAKNAYRVLLTRARQGMVIFVPPGSPDDPTRLPKYYDPTYEYLRELGIPEAV
jgi:hypothetical protein